MKHASSFLGISMNQYLSRKQSVQNSSGELEVSVVGMGHLQAKVITIVCAGWHRVLDPEFGFRPASLLQAVRF